MLSLSGGTFTVPAAADGADGERAAARSLAEQGSMAYNEQRFGDAVDLFERAEALVHSPVHLLYLARASVRLGRLVKAQEAYIKITREQLPEGAPEAFTNAAVEAQTELEALKPRIPHLTVRISGAGNRTPELLLDGQPVPAVLVGVPMPVDPGDHTLEARAEGAQSASQQLAVGEGHQGDVELVLTPVEAVATTAPEPLAPPPSAAAADRGGNDTMRYIGYGSLGLGAAGLVFGIVNTLSASRTQDEADSKFVEFGCDIDPAGRGPSDCTADQIGEIGSLDDDVASAKTLSVVGYAVGAVGIGAGVALLVLAMDDDDSASNEPRLTPWVGLNAVGLSGTF
jgi:hypothetical protein